MSRRKQARPRHLEKENELAALTPNGSKVDSPACPPQNTDAHVCGKCREEFLDVKDFVAHKNLCTKHRVVVLCQNSQNSNDSSVGLFNRSDSPLVSQLGVDSLEAASQDGGSDGEQNFENLATAEEEEEFGDLDRDIDSEEDMNFDDNMDDETDIKSDCSDFDEESFKDDEMFREKLKNELSSQLPLANLLPGGTNNVLLEPLEATKAAVAQFAENNLPSMDMAVLQSTLYNLQQQQIMQLQLIQQLQHQLLSSGQMPLPLVNDQLSQVASGQVPAASGLAEVTASSTEEVGKTSENTVDKEEEPVPTTTASSETSPLTTSEDKKSDVQTSAPINTTCSSTETKVVTSTTTSSVSPTSHTSPSKLSDPSTPPRTPRSSEHSSSHLSSSSISKPLLDVGRSNRLLDRNQFVSDDPFFKHKCRLCNKVFGSDSALQIHIRSHTGEKPFKCNVCGGRFSTRGNLKVHFQRHKQEFPHVEMNPNPVPEHLDKLHHPLFGSPFPPPIMAPMSMPSGFLGLPPGFMNGFLPQPPFSVPLPHKPPPVTNLVPSTHSSSMQEMRRRSSSPSPAKQPKKEASPTIAATEPPAHKSPDVTDTASVPASSAPIKSPPSGPRHSLPSPAIPTSSIPLVSNYPITSPLPSRPPFGPPLPPCLPPSAPMSGPDPFKQSILPPKLLDNDDDLEQYMECSKSETSKLQQLVDNIEHKLTDPNQCVICHRVLSCKSALQMHYRIHTGERPFKCKICSRAFTTKGNLKTHMGVHRAKPPLRMMHQCPVCHKQFTNLLVLQQHIKSHTGVSNLPSIPNLTHFGMMGHHGGDLNAFHHKPLDMSHYLPSFDKELDLSKKKPSVKDEPEEKTDGRSGGDLADRFRSENHIDRAEESMEMDGNPEDESDLDDEDINEKDDEANHFAAEQVGEKDVEDGGSSMDGRASADGQASASEAQEKTSERQEDISEERQEEHNEERPTSSQSFAESTSRGSAHGSLSPKYLQEAPSPFGGSQDGTGYNSAYSTSLAALEERVRAIDSKMANNPLSMFNGAPYLGQRSVGMVNGENSPPLSPRSPGGSESGSDNSRDGSNPMSVSSDGSVGNFMLGALDLRPPGVDSNRLSTTCNVCFKTFACRSALEIHYRSHTKHRPYKCEMCDRSFSTRGNMKQHLLTHKIRDLPSQIFNNNNDSNAPNQNENSNSGKSESSDIEVKKEETSPRIETSVPRSLTPSNTSTSLHSNSMLDSRKPDFDNRNQVTCTVKHQCQVCQKGFSSASALQIHIRTHTGDKPFKCTVCGKAFTTKGNLKVHMGTHMWNNSPSRRGRRMSIEPPFMMTHKENPYMPQAFSHRTPEFYPFQFPPFMNGMPGAPKLNEISVIQGLNNGLNPMIPPVSSNSDMTSPKGEMSKVNGNKDSKSPESVDDHGKFVTESGELDLSMKSNSSSSSRDSSKISPSGKDFSSPHGMMSPTSPAPLGWGWNSSCHLCSQKFPTPTALEHHLRTLHMGGVESHNAMVS